MAAISCRGFTSTGGMSVAGATWSSMPPSLGRSRRSASAKSALSSTSLRQLLSELDLVRIAFPRFRQAFVDDREQRHRRERLAQAA